ncbi:MAG: FAD-dependent oxidoreductase [Cyanobacteria bacterium SZAS LIN-3]|nr:FAD-dependent oxidoreductase [Cyanobacteria bacterium SZAS LIN-3]
MKSIAVIGSGIAGLGCAYFLAPHYAVTVFEKNDYTGGHTNTISVPPFGAESRSVSFDTGFMVYNHVTYPLLTRLFDQLGVPTKKTDMSFSVQYLPDNIEWNGAGLNKVFAQRRNLVSPRFWRMLMKLDWFNKNAFSTLEEAGSPEPKRSPIVHQTVRDYVESYKLGQDFLNWYLVPMGASVWSTPPDKMLDFPMAALIRFFHNHGFLGLDTHYQWYTVDGGAKKYVPLITAAYKDSIRHSAVVKTVRSIVSAEGEQMVEVVCQGGSRDVFDKVIMACHADEALAALDQPTVLQSQLLSPFKYQTNEITVHSDPAVMPATKLAWASWNYRVDRDRERASYAPTLHYWMNSLQGVSDTSDYFVSLNSDELIEQSLVHRKMKYTHPLFDLATFSAQQSLPQLNQPGVGGGNIYFCGSYFKNGFHEDAFRSAVDLASTILGTRVF